MFGTIKKVDQSALKVLGNIWFHVPNEPFGPIIIKLVLHITIANIQMTSIQIIDTQPRQ